jgi:hypothetical protein
MARAKIRQSTSTANARRFNWRCRGVAGTDKLDKMPPIAVWSINAILING